LKTKGWPSGFPGLEYIGKNSSKFLTWISQESRKPGADHALGFFFFFLLDNKNLACEKRTDRYNFRKGKLFS
jgi:hypothetical protein